MAGLAYVLLLACLGCVARPGSDAAAGSEPPEPADTAGGAAGTTFAKPTRLDLGPQAPESLSLFADGGPVLLVWSSRATPGSPVGRAVADCAEWIVSPAGEVDQRGPDAPAGAAARYAPAPADVVARQGERLAAYAERWQAGSVLALLDVGLDGEAERLYPRIPGYHAGTVDEGVNGGQPRHPAWGAGDPSLALSGEQAWLVFVNYPAGYELTLTSSAWGQWSEWTRAVRLGQGLAPSLATTVSCMYVSFTECADRVTEPIASGRPLLLISDAGSTWSEPMLTVDEPRAHRSALVADDEVGLVLVYTAEREDGWPVFAARSMDNGETWGRPVMLTDRTVYAWRPDAMLHDGVLYVAYLGMPTPPTREGSASDLADPEGAYLLTVDPATLPMAGE